MTVKILVPVSGGKDSQACLKLATQNYPLESIRGLFCDTGFEHPLTYAHVDRLRCLYGDIQIDTVSRGTVLQKVVKYKRFPSFAARHCTDELKLKPTRDYCKQLAQSQGCGFEVWYGMRHEESAQRATRYAGMVCDELYPPHEVMPVKYPQYLAKMGVMFRLAILDWSRLDVLEYLQHDQSPLYQWFDRVGCFPCLAAGDKEKEKAFEHDDFGREQYQRVQIVSRSIGKSVWTSKGGLVRHADDLPEAPGCAVCVYS